MNISTAPGLYACKAAAPPRRMREGETFCASGITPSVRPLRPQNAANAGIAAKEKALLLQGFLRPSVTERSRFEPVSPACPSDGKE